MANITVTRTGTVPTVTLDLGNRATIVGGDELTMTPYIIDATNPTYDLFADGYNADDIGRDLALQTALDAGEVTVDLNGVAILTGSELSSIGTGTLAGNVDNQTLAEVLAEGNLSGANDILMGDAQKVQLGASTNNYITNVGTNQVELSVNREFVVPIQSSSANAQWSFDDTHFLGEDDDFLAETNFTDQKIRMQDKAAGFYGSLLFSIFGGLTAARDWQLPDASGTVALTSQLSSYQLTSEKNAANGYAGLDASSKINPSQLPAIAITDTFVVASQAAMLALVAQTGDIAVRTDVEQTFILQGTDPSVLGDWVLLQTPTDAVASVFGRTGVVTAQSGDYTAAQVTNAFDKTADDTDDITEGATNKFATTAEKNKLGFITVTQAVDLDTMESNIATNNAKVTNATHTGDVTGATALTIANDAVTYAKMQNVSAASRLLGRGSAAGAGDTQELTLGTGLALTGTVLSATAGLPYFQSSSAEAVDTTSSTTYVQKLTFTTSSLTAGDYRIDFYGEVRTSGNNIDVGVQLGVDNIEVCLSENAVRDSGLYEARSGFVVKTLTAATHKLDINVKVQSGTLTFRRLRVAITRVA